MRINTSQIRLAFSLFGVVCSVSWGGWAEAATLEQCYKGAIQTSETLSISDEEIRQIELEYRKGVGSVLPNLSWNMTQFYQDTPNVVTTSTSGVQSTLLDNRRPESFFLLRQPLFHGFREFNAIKGIKVATKQAEKLKDQAMLSLLADVATIFYTSLDLQQEVEALIEQRKLLGDRVEELSKRTRLGKSRDSETLSARVDLVSLDGLIEDTRRTLGTSRYTLFFLTQVPINEPLTDASVPAVNLTIKEAIDKSIKRPDLMAAEYAKQVEQMKVKYAKGAHMPSLDVAGKYYTEREGFNEEIKWDALFALNVPIFEGGATQAEVRAAHSRYVVSDLEARRLQRQIRREVEIAHQNLGYGLSQAKFYHEAVLLAEKNFKLNQQEYRLGLINNLDVLRVLSQMQDLKVRDLRAQASAKIFNVLLRVAMGEGL